METVKIDLQKLQQLNDRINQTIDALNQVRLSTHGLQHSGAQLGAPQQWGQPQIGALPPQQQAFNPFGQGYPAQGVPFQAISGGIEHSTPRYGQPMGQVAFNPALGQMGYGQTLAPAAFGQPYAQGQVGFPSGLGISHTAPTVDPYWQMRAPMSAPYPQYPVAPMVSY